MGNLGTGFMRMVDIDKSDDNNAPGLNESSLNELNNLKSIEVHQNVASAGPVPPSLISEGKWFFTFIVFQYIIYFAQKCITLCITNKLRSEFEEKKARI